MQYAGLSKASMALVLRRRRGPSQRRGLQARCISHGSAGQRACDPAGTRTDGALTVPSTSQGQAAASDSAELAAALNASGCATSWSCAAPCQVS